MLVLVSFKKKKHCRKVTDILPDCLFTVAFHISSSLKTISWLNGLLNFFANQTKLYASLK